MSRAKDLFLDALDLEPDQRDRFLEGQAGDDSAILQRISSGDGAEADQATLMGS